VLAATASACSGTQSALAPAGPQAQRIANLWWLFFSVLIVVYALVVTATLAAIFRRRGQAAADGAQIHYEVTPPAAGRAPEGLPPRSDSSERRLSRVIVGSTAVTVIVLMVFLFASIRTGNALSGLESADPVRVEVTGHQWWWEVTYKHVDPSKQFTTANELHLPLHQPVEISTTSADVIHSLWIPNLHGKQDLIPGRLGRLWIQADREGVYRAQCAEFCGMQHAHMALHVVVEPVSTFNAWLDRQRQPAPAPRTAAQQHGQRVFLSGPCVMCHTIGGTPAMSRVGPSLTHFGSRTSIAAGYLPNTPGYLGAWIADPQHLKPGARMPSMALEPGDLQALIEYLHSLK
jgi:cytochrome c oxidase subunit 2